jgi:hypothetical protein
MARPYDSSPAERLQAGSTRRPRGLNDAVLRGKIGHTTGNIRLTPTAATIVGSAAYNFGKIDDRAIGTYRLEYQGAASATAEALGAIVRVEFTIYENTAGVYLCKINRVGDADGGLAAAADGHQVNDDADAEWSATAVADNTKALLVVDAAAVTAYDGVATAEVDIAVGDLLLFDGSDTGTRVYSLTRIS